MRVVMAVVGSVLQIAGIMLLAKMVATEGNQNFMAVAGGICVGVAYAMAFPRDESRRL